MRLRVLFFMLLQCLADVALCQAPVLLLDGQQITVTGRLTPEPAGRLQFIAVQTSQFYVPVMRYDGAEHNGEPTRDIGLSDFPSYAALYAHRGDTVTVSGIVKTDPASPYYLHNISVTVRSIHGAHGENLLPPAPSPARAAVDTGMYQAIVLLPADPAAPWQYRVQGGSGIAKSMMSCGSNGGGDVVNCFCAPGFHASEALMESRGKESHGGLMGNAQFEMPDDDVTGEIELFITCSR